MHRAASGPTRFTSGRSLGAFTILEPLGAGGMGEVYRVRDTRLDRLRVEVSALVLEAGDIEEAISVQGGADLVQTTTGARSAGIPQLTFEDITLKGRDPIGMLKLLPGILDTNAREAPSWNVLSLLTNPNAFGRLTGATNSARRIQLAVRFTF